MEKHAVDEQGLLAYNYEAEDVNGKIDNSSNDIDMNFSFIDSKTQNTHKEPVYSPNNGSQDQMLNQNAVAVNQSNNNNATSGKTSDCQSFCTAVFYWIVCASFIY